jgi:hypothetical protein
LGLPNIRHYWQQINREDRAAAAEHRARQKARDKKRRKCGCDAYKFPHRPGSGLCRYPDPPAVRWQDARDAEIVARVTKFNAQHGEPTPEAMADLIALTTKPCRKYDRRYTGIIRQIARSSGFHPIRDRDLIKRLMPTMLYLAKQLKRKNPRIKFRNMKVYERTPGNWRIMGEWTTAGPTM